MTRKMIMVVGAAFVLALAIAVPANAASGNAAITGHHLWLNGERLSTVVVSSPLPNGGLDPIYAIFVNGAMFGDGIAAVGPGVGSYHGGAWAVNVVTFNQGYMPHQFASAAEVLAAANAGMVTITRVPAADFRCPVLPY
jgi:hypothetical protein